MPKYTKYEDRGDSFYFSNENGEAESMPKEEAALALVKEIDAMSASDESAPAEESPEAAAEPEAETSSESAESEPVADEASTDEPLPETESEGSEAAAA